MLKNSDGQYAVIVDMNKSTVNLMVYRNKTQALTPSHWFDKDVPMNAVCGEELGAALSTSPTTEGITKDEDVKLTAYAIIAEQALENPERHRAEKRIYNEAENIHEMIYLKGDWIIE